MEAVPLGRYDATAAWDVARDRMIVFGGGFREYPYRLNDTWAFPPVGPVRWTKMNSTGSLPAARQDHSIIHDPVRDRLVAFGGLAIRPQGGTPQPRADVWVLRMNADAQWTLLANGTIASRYGHTAIYDPVGDRMIVFGGLLNSTTAFNDVWALSLSGTPLWTRRFPSGEPPPARAQHTAIYDPVRNRMIVFGGISPTSGALGDVWSLSLGTAPEWTQLAPTGKTPTPRFNSVAIYDPQGDRMVVFGGGQTQGPDFGETYALSLGDAGVWDSLVVGSPGARQSPAATYDPVRGRLVIFGGGGIGLNDVWALPLAGGSWTLLAPNIQTRPIYRTDAAGVYDPVRQQLVVFGGQGYGGVYNDLWTLTLGGLPTWSQPATTGTPPAARRLHAAIYDPVRDQLVIFGGYDVAHRNDTWVLPLSTLHWAQLSPAGVPPAPRSACAAIYDPAGDRMLIFGGASAGGTRNDLWALSLGGYPTWEQLSPSGPLPSARSRPSGIYDPVRDQMVVFGGFDGLYQNDTWALALGEAPAWTHLAPGGTLPPGRFGHTAIYDEARDRLVVFGGENSQVAGMKDTWELPLGPAPTWRELAPAGSKPNPRSGQVAAYDRVWDRMVMFSGFADILYSDDTWMLFWGSTVGVDAERGEAHSWCRVVPNPSRGASRLEFELAAPVGVRVAVYDLAGRLVRTLLDGSFPPGRQQARWDGTGPDGQASAPGVYFYRLRAGSWNSVRKVVVLR
jgi:hypothetical protein